jgi:diguanylate cyclase (GGDEF)-like protein
LSRPWHRGPRALISISVVVICVHALLNTLFPAAGFTISYLLWTFWALAASTACLWRSFHSADSLRIHWRLAAASLFCIFTAGAIEAPAEIFFKAAPTVASAGDFFFFSAFVPILLSITLPDEGLFLRSAFLLDSLQAAACSYLAYTVLMGIFPFTATPAQGMPYAHLELVYDAEYLTVVLLAALRYFLGTQTSDARNPGDRYFFRVILLYTSLYAVTSGIYNHYVGKLNLTNGLDALNDIPSAALALAALFAPVADTESPRHASRPMLVRLIDNARPVFLSLALISLSAAVAVRHIAIAFAFIFGAFVLYSLRASTLQSKVEHTQAELHQLNTRLSEIALLDGLTGIANRRGFDQRLAVEWRRAQRNRQPLSLLLIDVDHFKRINDTHGHQAGDEYLRHIAQLLSAAFDRPADLIARYGGEEFAVLLPETDSSGASAVAAHIRALMEQDAGPAGFTFPITVSIGVSTWSAAMDVHRTPSLSHAAQQSLRQTPGQLITAADRALYAAKQNGRNRVESAGLQYVTVNEQ